MVQVVPDSWPWIIIWGMRGQIITLFNNVHISRCLFFVSDILDDVAKIKSSSTLLQILLQRFVSMKMQGLQSLQGKSIKLFQKTWIHCLRQKWHHQSLEFPSESRQYGRGNISRCRMIPMLNISCSRISLNKFYSCISALHIRKRLRTFRRSQKKMMIFLIRY